MKARIPKHREFVIDMKEVPEAQRTNAGES